MSLFAKKSISSLLEEAGEGGNKLKRTLGPTGLIALGIGAIIGAGLFSITGVAAGENAGPAITISFIIAAVGCAFAGLCYAEFASMIPVAGSAYTYSYATMGRFIAWIIGWDLVLEYAVGAATVASSWSGYFYKFMHNMGINFPRELTMTPWDHVHVKGGKIIPEMLNGVANPELVGADHIHGIMNLPAVLVVVLLSLVLIRGTRESSLINGIIVSLKLMVVVLFIGLGWAYINTDNYTPYIPENTGEFGHYGWSGIIRAAGIVFFAYIGFDAVSTAAQEAKNPRRDMPIGILVSLVICTILYLLFAHVMTGMAHYTEFKADPTDKLAPVATALAHTPYTWLNQGIILAILAGYMSVILVMLMGQSRVFFSMSHDGLLPKYFSNIHPKYKTPHHSNLIFMVFVSLFAAFVPGSVVGEMTSIGTLLAFILVCAGVLYMRYKMPEAPRGFRTPLVPLVPILGILVCLGMMVFLPLDTWIRLFVWMAIGIAIFFAYSNKNADKKEADRT
ncbi:MAG: amino acid permease [Bacteroidetes bacterium]|nr:amino acid permease [Bacteroidota bacterium]